MTRVAIIAAMAGELKPLVRGWRHERREIRSAGSVDLWRWRYDEGEWVAACAGAGAEPGARAFAEIAKDGPISIAISIGWAGALNDDVALGQAYKVSCVIDARTGERFDVAGGPDGRLVVTNPIVADEQEKRRLRATYGADLCDMEGAVVARLAAMRGIPFYSFKGVSDGFSEKLPDFNRFISTKGQFQMARFILFATLRPIYWPALIRMGENGRKASQSIAESLLDFLDERGHIRKRNGYPNFKP
jgi:adenosylhomocysteine nucleosidase